MDIDSASLREIEARDKNQEPRQYQVVSIKTKNLASEFVMLLPIFSGAASLLKL